MLDLNKPFEGDLCYYGGATWVYFEGKWVRLDDAMKMTFDVSKR